MTPEVPDTLAAAMGRVHQQLEKEYGVNDWTILAPMDLNEEPVLRVVVEYGDMGCVKTVEYRLRVVGE